jgi:hypothetical protein
LPSISLSGVSSLILFPLFATGVNDTGGKFAAGVVDTGGTFPQAPDNNIRIISNFFEKFAEIFASQSAPRTGVNDIGGKFATGVIDTGGAP